MVESKATEARTEAPDAAGDEVVELRVRPERNVSLARWFVPYGAALAALGGVWLAWGDAHPAARLAGFLAYMSVCCTFLPLPTTIMVLWAAAPAAKGGLGLPPLALATLGAAGTGVANMHDYHLLTALYRLRTVKRVRMTRLYRRMAAWFHRSPFATLAAFSFLPIPIDFVRLLAISEGYPRWRFALGSVVGRWPRYVLLAYLAEGFDLGWQWVLGIGGAAAVLGLARGLPTALGKFRDYRRARRAAKEDQR